MMPRIQFSYDEGDGLGELEVSSVPRHVQASSVIRDSFCNPNGNCSPVCCCCGLLSIRTAVKGVVWIAIVFSIWEVSMGCWLLIETSCCLEPILEEGSTKSTAGLRQLSTLRGAGWLLIVVGLFRLLGLVYLLYSVSSEDRARKLPTIFCMSISILIGLILTYPMFISIPGKGISVPEGSHLKDFNSAYSTLHTLDLLLMTFYSLYAILYYIIISDHYSRNPNNYDCDVEDDGRRRESSVCRNHRFEPIEANIRLT